LAICSAKITVAFKNRIYLRLVMLAAQERTKSGFIAKFAAHTVEL
jgi:hypothetical protein